MIVSTENIGTTMDTLEQKVINFSVIKEKIIKTDEVLKLLKKSQHDSKEWKNKYKQIAMSLKRSQLETDRFSTHIEALKSKQQILEEENKNLNEQHAYLEEKYNSQVVESMQMVRELQDEVRMLQELNSAQPNDGQASSDTSLHRLTEENEHLKLQLTALSNNKKRVEEENNDKQEELQLKIQQYSKEITELKSQIKSILGNSTTDKQKLEHLEKQVQSLTIVKQKYDGLQREHKLLTDQLAEAKLEIEQLKAVTANKSCHDMSIQTDEVILKEQYTSKENCHNMSIQTDEVTLTEQYTSKENCHNMSIQTDEVTLTEQYTSKKNCHNMSIQTDEVTLTEQYTSKKNCHNMSIQTDEVTPKEQYTSKKNCHNMSIQTDEVTLKEQYTSTDDLLTSGLVKSETELQSLKNHISKQNNKQNCFILENQALTEKLKMYEETIRILEDQVISPKTNILSQSESIDSAIDSDFEPDGVDDILSEMIFVPRMVSPFLCDIRIKEEPDEHQDIPNIVITPSTPTEKIFEEQKHPVGEKCSQFLQEIKSESIKIEEGQNALSRKRRNKTCFSYNDFIREQSWRLRQRIKKRKLNQKKKRITDGFLNSLQALKRSNINFVISNESTAPQHQYFNPITKENISLNSLHTKQSLSTQSIGSLTCQLKNCTPTYMLINNTGKVDELLGFSSNKPEDSKPVIFSKECSPKNVAPDPPNNSKPEISSNEFINKIAEVVCEKLKKEGVAIEKPKISSSTNTNSESLDSLCSETETEIEELFKKQPIGVLKQQKMLWDDREYTLHITTDDSSHTDDTSSETRSYSVTTSGVPSSQSSENSYNFHSTSSVDSVNNTVTNEVSQISKNDTYNCFKVPVCPKMLSPICSTASDIEKSPYYIPPVMSNGPQLLSPLYSTPKPPMSVKKLTFSPGYNLEKAVNSNVSYYINKILQDRHNSAYKLNRFLDTLPEERTNSLTKSNFNSTDNDTYKTKESYNKMEINQNIGEDLSKLDHTNEEPVSNTTYINSGCQNMSNNIGSYAKSPPKVIPPERHKSCNNDGATTECGLRRSKRICDRRQSTQITSRKRRKTYLLESSDTEEECLNSLRNSVESNLEKTKNVDEAKETNINCDMLKESCIKDKFVDKDTTKTLVLSSDKALSIKRKRKPISKLKSKVLQQMRVKTKMMDNKKVFNHYGCDKLDTSNEVLGDKNKNVSLTKNLSPNNVSLKNYEMNSTVDQTCNNKYEAKDHGTIKPLIGSHTGNNISASCTELVSSDKATTKVEKNKKINIVQNFLIPPHSKIAIDLLNVNKKQKNAPRDVLCDILYHMNKNKPKTAMKCLEAKEKVPVGIDRKKFRDNVLDIAEVIHGGLKITDGVKIFNLKDTVKNMPETTMKCVEAKEKVPVGIDDKKFRDNLLDIAEAIHGGLKSYDDVNVFELKGRDKSVQESNILKKGSNLSWKLKALLAMFYKSTDEGNISKEVMRRFKLLPMTQILDIILHQVSRNFSEQPLAQYVNAPLLTEKQKLFLCLMLRLENEKYPQMTEAFLSRTEQFLFLKGCNIRHSVPIVRLYLAICRLRGDIMRVRKFLCDGFYHMGDIAVPVCFAILTNWVEVFPKWENIQSFPLSKVLFQVIHLKECSSQGYNLFPLKCLLSQYYEFPKERLNCEEFFKEVYDQYLNEPSTEREIAIRLLCKNKPKLWVYDKLNKFFKPLVYKIPSENINFRATVIILMGKLCYSFRSKYPVEEGYLTELRRWFLGLVEDGADKVIKDSVSYVLDRLPKKKFVKKALQKKEKPK